ncbi:DUF1983 domain-containing protein [Photobacterium damselae]|uniref:phage tail tip fiber protein n=1 Tax=Photobacterium damselae TaxID=38293 RepID=UPI0025429782
MARSPIARSGFRGDRSAASLQENMELLTGQRGDGLDRALTLRDMVSLGVLGAQRNGNGSVIPKPLPPVTPDGGVVEMPHAPKGFRGMGGFGAIMLEWTNPTFKGYAHTEVWRAAPLANQAKPSIGDAVLIATTPATVFGDIVKPGSTFYYWIRFINLNDISGPYNGVDGVKVSTSPDISDIIDDVGEQMKDSELIQDLNKGIEGVTAAVQENTKVIEKLNADGSKAYQSMWNVKAQAGDIKAGIGILADSNGKSQVAVAASQFFVFDPNVEGGETKPLFAIDKGNVIIPKAYIETATIQILNAQTIVADEVKAGVSIKSPVIEGGSVTGGWAGFGPGGRFNGWRTYINASGQIFTDGINAVNGSYAGHLYATSGEMQNVIIHESCRVHGTIYAKKIIGDLVAMNGYTQGPHEKRVDYYQEVEIGRFRVSGGVDYDFQRTIIIQDGWNTVAVDMQYKYWAEIRVVLDNGSNIYHSRFEVGRNQDYLGLVISPVALTIPPKYSGSIRILVKGQTTRFSKLGTSYPLVCIFRKTDQLG